MATRRDGASRRLVWTMCLLHLLPSVHGQCAMFEFEGSTTPSSENCTVEVPLSNPLPFSMNSHNCSRGQQSFTMTVSIHDSQRPHGRQICKLRITEGKCRNLGGVCLCGQSKGRYYLKEELSNGTLLTLRANVNFVKEARVCIREQDVEKINEKSDEKSNEEGDGSYVRTVIIVVVVVMLVVPVVVLVPVAVKRRRVKIRKTDGQLRSAGRTYFREVQSSVLRDDMTASVYGTDHDRFLRCLDQDKGGSRFFPPSEDEGLQPPWTIATASSHTRPPDQLQPIGVPLPRFDF